jgi:hypothetical protein
MRGSGQRRAGMLVAAAIAVAGFCQAVPSQASQPSLLTVTSLQCPSSSLCVGIAAGGANLVTSRAPRSGIAGWTAQTIDGARRLRLLSCASVRWCVAVDQQDRVLISTDPARGAASWRPAPGGPASHLDNVGSLSCPTARLCIGVAGHYVISSVDPRRGGAAWPQALVNPNAPTDAVDCPTTTRCIAAAIDGQVLTSSDPTGRSAWKTARLARLVRPIGSDSVSCASSSECVVAVGNGQLFSTTNLDTPAPSWNQARLPTNLLPRHQPLRLTVSCTAADVCAAVGNDGSVWASPAPSRSGQRRWRRVAVDPEVAGIPDALTTLACVSGPLCVAADQDGHLLTASAITRPGAWRQQPIGTGIP